MNAAAEVGCLFMFFEKRTMRYQNARATYLILKMQPVAHVCPARYVREDYLLNQRTNAYQHKGKIGTLSQYLWYMITLQSKIYI